MKKHSKALDLIIMSALKLQQGKPVEAAKFLVQASEAEDFDATLEDLNDQNDEALEAEGEDLDMVDELSKAMASAKKPTKKVAKAKKVVKAGEGEPDGDEGEPDGDEEVESEGEELEDLEVESEGEDDLDELEESAKVRRQKRAKANARILAAAQKRVK